MVISICVHTPRKSISTSRLEKRRTSNPSAVKNAEPPGVFQLTVVLWYGHGFPSQSAAPTALPEGEPSSARNALHRTVYKSAPLLSVRQTGIRTTQIFHPLLAVIRSRQNRRKALKSLDLLRNQNHPKLSSFIRCYP